jgi:hypothetical protein
VLWVESGLEQDGNSLRDLGPSSEAETHPRGRQALERSEGFVVRRLALERDGGSPEGCRGRLFDGPLRLFGPWAFLCLAPRSCKV